MGSTENHGFSVLPVFAYIPRVVCFVVYAGSDNQPCIMNDRTMVQIRPIYKKQSVKSGDNQ